MPADRRALLEASYEVVTDQLLDAGIYVALLTGRVSKADVLQATGYTPKQLDDLIRELGEVGVKAVLEAIQQRFRLSDVYLVNLLRLDQLEKAGATKIQPVRAPLPFGRKN